ncbi:transcriptional regulator with XRE-family HTH domain [Sporomusaceae bacterium BoRhaA]|jgi:transcriptional regulator with XRE-family HTH domain|uniref:helix-turn-helix domain-containing protein n=1 Tax=Pelorhabdus rhamnosifermentans TaxID=2772457 RepID=UPI001C05F5C0|nr:XRE family transcriptional regulator [Pelorhabdus rhamnosifermentans]MBU2703773.1 transcriptional regulator with XRE-family HTH domain [Pelorhabdus rhamnosifermentans]
MENEIGKKVKELRTHKKLTLKDLSELTTLSTGFLSQLERGLTNIATDSLQKIAQAFDVELAYFFPSPNKNRKCVLRSYEKEVFQVVNSRFIHYHLTNDFPERALLPRLIELLPINSQEDISPYAHEGEEFIYVLEGTVTLFINHEQVELFPGDSAHYASTTLHNWANYTNKMVRMLVVSSPNPFTE